MSEIENPIEMGKVRLSNYDIPSAVLCFEAACQKTPENAEAWLLLGKFPLFTIIIIDSTIKIYLKTLDISPLPPFSRNEVIIVKIENIFRYGTS